MKIPKTYSIKTKPVNGKLVFWLGVLLFLLVLIQYGGSFIKKIVTWIVSLLTGRKPVDPVVVDIVEKFYQVVGIGVQLGLGIPLVVLGVGLMGTLVGSVIGIPMAFMGLVFCWQAVKETGFFSGSSSKIE